MKGRPRRRVLRKVLLAISAFLLVINLEMFISAGILQASIAATPPDSYEEYCTKYDEIKPEISPSGGVEVNVHQGEEYKDMGATTYDYCETSEPTVLSEVNVNEIGVYSVKYSTKDKRGNEAETTRIVHVVPKNTGVIYLTFDDGPGPETGRLLDTLSKYNVKATFFVTGAGEDEMIAREYNEGHAVGLHTLSHDYSYIYSNTDAFFEDLYAVQERVKNITGYTSQIMRFPGGSSNTVSRRYDGRTRIMSRLTREVEERGFTYFDWNVLSGDAGEVSTSDEVFENVTSGLIPDGKSVVLQHDIKGFSVDAVEEIIKYGLRNGYTFDKLSTDSFTAHHGVNN